MNAFLILSFGLLIIFTTTLSHGCGIIDHGTGDIHKLKNQIKRRQHTKDGNERNRNATFPFKCMEEKIVWWKGKRHRYVPKDETGFGEERCRKYWCWLIAM